jgi:pyrrolidone-carboxylate peptidase
MNILLTAFGPFRNFNINPSDEIMTLLLEKLKNHFPDIIFYSQVLDVSYNSVDSYLESVDQHYEFIFHMGVATNNDKIRIEFWPKNFVKGTDIAQVTKEGMIDSNNLGFLKADNLITEKCIEFIKSSTWMKDSYDAGNYLCNYIFYKSMKMFKTSKVLFFHVSDFVNNEQSPDKATQATELYKLIVYLLTPKSK